MPQRYQQCCFIVVAPVEILICYQLWRVTQLSTLLTVRFSPLWFADIPSLVARALRRGCKEWRRSKLSVVGEGRAGKTALTNAIIGRTFADADSTLGINQLTCDVKHVKSAHGVSTAQSAGAGGELRWTEVRREDRELESALAESVAVLKLKRARGESDGAAGADSDILSLLMAAKAAAGSPSGATGSRGAAAGQQGRGAQNGSSPALAATVIAASARAQTSTNSSGSSTPRSSSPTTSSAQTTPATSSAVTPVDRPLDEDMVVRALATITDAETGLLISLFDFGGQSVFDVIHHLFLTRNGVYALVFSMEWLLTPSAADCDRALRLLQRWLSSVAVHTFDANTQRTAPIVFVGTRLDRVATPQEHLAISRLLYDTFSDHPAWTSVIANMEPLQEHGSSLRECLWFFPVSNPAGCGCPAMRKLMKTVHTAMDSAVYTHKDVPLTWFKVIDQMRDTEKDCLSLSEVVAIAARCNVSEQEVPFLLTFLHDMGHLMWLDEPELRDVVILDAVKYLVTPATVIICNILPANGEAVQHVLPVHHECAHQCKDEWNALRREGVLHVKLLPILWKEYAARTDMLLLLMVKFGLLVPLRPERTGISGVKAGTVAVPPQSQTADMPSAFIVPALLTPAPLARSEGVHDWTDSPVSSVYFVFTLSDDKLQSNCAISERDLKGDGFLPGGMFERIVGKALSWSQDTAKGGRLNLRSVLLHKDVAVLAFGRQRFRLVHCADIHCVRADIEGTHPLSVMHKLQVLVDKIIAECLPFLRWFPALAYAAPASAAVTPAEDPLHKRLAAGEVLVPLQLARDAAVGETVLTWRGGRVMLTEEQVRAQYAPWLQLYGLKATYDVFISYRWGSYDSVFTEQLFDMFTNYTVGTTSRAVEVFLDVKCLQKGQLFKSDFAAALTHCHVALPILSVDALQRLLRHKPHEVDNVLLEWVMILECFTAKRLKRVYPMVFGERTKSGLAGSRLTVADYFADNRVKSLPTTVPAATLAKAAELLRANGVEPSDRLTRYTVRSIVHQLPEFLLCKANDFDPVELVEAYVKEVVTLLKQCAASDNAVAVVSATAAVGSATVEAGGIVPAAPAAASGTAMPPLSTVTAAAPGATTAITTTTSPTTSISAITSPDTTAVKQLRELTAIEVCTLVERLGFPEISATFAQLQVTGAKLSFCREASNLRSRYFGIDEDFVAEGLFEQIQEWKRNGVIGL
jgi:GTPase SAR1 family protein